jgi:hypothetical protein
LSWTKDGVVGKLDVARPLVSHRKEILASSLRFSLGFSS